MSDALLAAALDAHQRGQYDLAAERYEALTTDLTLSATLRADASYWRGVLALQQSSAPAASGASTTASAVDGRTIDTALRAFDAALALYPDHPAAQLNRGHAYRHAGKRDAAREAYKIAIALCGIRLRASEISEAVPPSAQATDDHDPTASARRAPTSSDTTTARASTSEPAPRSAARAPDVAAAALSALGTLHAEDASAGVESIVDLGVPTNSGHAAAGTSPLTARSVDRPALLANALACFDAALMCSDAHPATHDQRGLVLAALGRYEDAEAAHRQALMRHAGHPGFLNNVAIALKAQGRLDEAAAAFRDALRVAPDFVPALINLGQTVALQGEHDQATAPLLRAAHLAPDLDLVHCELAQAFLAQGKHEPALHHAERAVAIAPQGPTGWQNLGAARYEAGDAVGAAKAFDRVIALTPIPARAAAAAAALPQPESVGIDQGGALARPADPTLLLAPIYALARFSRACLLLSEGGSPAGWRQFEARLALGNGSRSTSPPMRANGRPLPRWLGEPAGQHRMPLPSRGATRDQRTALPSHAEPTAGATDASATPGKTTDGTTSSTHGASVDTAATGASHIAAIAAERVSVDAVYLRLPGRTLLVLAEQGYGDTMQFLRFVGCLTARGANVVLALQPALRPLMNDHAAISESVRNRRLTVITHGVDPLPASIDAYCHIGSLPACLRMGKLPRPGDAGTWGTPYLFSPQITLSDAAHDASTTAAGDATTTRDTAATANGAGDTRSRIASRLRRGARTDSAGQPEIKRTLKIGFAWSGRRPGTRAAQPLRADGTQTSQTAAGRHQDSPDADTAADDFENAIVRFDKRAIPLDEMAPLLYLTHTEWHPLQTDIRADEYALLEALSDNAQIVLPEKPAADFATTVRRIAALDHVVTIDTSIAHLAGAMGKPTTLLLSHVADWRWCSDGSKGRNAPDISLWYPSIRIVRQPRHGDWTAVIEQAAALLDASR